jgi:hypothetical protein
MRLCEVCGRNEKETRVNHWKLYNQTLCSNCYQRKKHNLPDNKFYSKKSEDKICGICGLNEKDANVRFVRSRKFQMMLCNKHYLQMQRDGETKKRTKRDPNTFIIKDDYCEIILYNIKSEEVGRALIDLEDIARCKKYKWTLNNRGYAFNSNYVGLLHHFILDFEYNKKENIVTDHINRNRLDNRKRNLRLIHESKNHSNISLKSNNTSGVMGVYKIKNRPSWEAFIAIDGNRISLKSYKTKKEAIIARLKAEKKYFGELYAPQRHLFKNYNI